MSKQSKENIIDECHELKNDFEPNSQSSRFNKTVNILFTDLQKLMQNVKRFRHEHSNPKRQWGTLVKTYVTTNYFQMKIISIHEYKHFQEDFNQTLSIIHSIQQEIKKGQYTQKDTQLKFIKDSINQLKNLSDMITKCQKIISSQRSLNQVGAQSKLKSTQHLNLLLEALNVNTNNLIKFQKGNLKNQQYEFIKKELVRLAKENNENLNKILNKYHQYDKKVQKTNVSFQFKEFQQIRKKSISIQEQMITLFKKVRQQKLESQINTNQLKTIIQQKEKQSQKKSNQIKKLNQRLISFQIKIIQLTKQNQQSIKQNNIQLQQLKYQLQRSQKLQNKTKEQVITEISNLLNQIEFDNNNVIKLCTLSTNKVEQIYLSVQKIQGRSLTLDEQLTKVLLHFNIKKTQVLKKFHKKSVSNDNMNYYSQKQKQSSKQSQQKYDIKQFSSSFFQLMNLMQYLMKKVTNTHMQKIKLLKQFNTSSNQLKSLHQSITKQKQRQNNLQLKSIQLNKIIKQKQQKVIYLKQTEQKLHKQFINNIHSTFKQTVQITQLTQQLQALQTQLQNDKKTIQNLQQQIQNYKTQIQSLTQNNHSNHDLSAQVLKLQQQITKIKAQSQNTIKQLKQESSRLSSSIQFEKGKNQANQKEIASLKESVTKLTDQKINLKLETQRMTLQIKNLFEKDIELQKMIKIKQNQNQVLSIDFEAKINELNEIKEENELKIKAFNGQIVEQKHKIETQGKQIEGLRNQKNNLGKYVITLQRIEKQKIQLDKQMKQLNKEIKELQKEIERNNRQLANKNQSKDQEIKNLLMKISQYQKLLFELKSKNQSQSRNFTTKYQKQIQNFKKDLQEKENIHKALSKNIVSLKEKIQRLNQQLLISKQNETKRTQQLGALKNLTQQRSIQLNKSFKQERQRLQAQLKLKNTTIQDLQDDLIDAQKEISKLKERLNRNGMGDSQIFATNMINKVQSVFSLQRQQQTIIKQSPQNITQSLLEIKQKHYPQPTPVSEQLYKHFLTLLSNPVNSSQQIYLLIDLLFAKIYSIENQYLEVIAQKGKLNQQHQKVMAEVLELDRSSSNSNQLQNQQFYRKVVLTDNLQLQEIQKI